MEKEAIKLNFNTRQQTFMQYPHLSTNQDKTYKQSFYTFTGTTREVIIFYTVTDN